MSPDHERRAEALMIERQHGERAAVFVAERIDALAFGGDAAGGERLGEIVPRLDQLPDLRQFRPAPLGAAATKLIRPARGGGAEVAATAWRS